MRSGPRSYFYKVEVGEPLQLTGTKSQKVKEALDEFSLCAKRMPNDPVLDSIKDVQTLGCTRFPSINGYLKKVDVILCQKGTNESLPNKNSKTTIGLVFFVWIL